MKKINTEKIKQKAREYALLAKEKGLELWARAESDRIERNRMLVLGISLALIFNYVVFCFHTGKSVFDIFPSFPVIDTRDELVVYIPDTDGKTLLKETRNIPALDDRDELVRLLFKSVAVGSYYENTSMAVPADLGVRGVWFFEETCVIDLGLAVLRENAESIPGSESNFRLAVEKTITENIPGIKSVMILERGIPGKNLWEVASKKR
ncbi:MAG: hypothetical protein EPN93_13090 [Spirochaetes bacterium]|nr:MAG: hypothetical protein EPN93_13090 [Spirochaetota bacterium]